MPLPSLPPLPISWRSRVFGDQTSGQEGTADASENVENLPDPERLAFIGDAVVHLGLTAWLHEHYPKYRGSTLMAKMTDLLSKQPAEWAKAYKLSSQLAVATATSETRNHSLSKGDLFRAYVAAVYLSGGGAQGGGVITSGWIKQILDCEREEGNVGSGSEDSSDECEIRNKPTAGGDEFSEMSNTLLTPSSPARRTGHGPAARPPPASVNIQVSYSRNFLSTLNEKATQKRVMLTWSDDSSGPDHAKTWVSKLLVEGREYVGTGHNKKQARNTAAEVALKALKWG